MAVIGVMTWNLALRRRILRQSEALTKELEEKESAKKALKEVELMLRRAQKMEAIGCMAGGVAHDFNNILTIILNYGMGLRDRLARLGIPSEEVDEILATSERAVRLTRQLLAFSRPTPTDLAPIDLCGVLREVTAMLQRLVSARVHIETSLPDHPVVVMAEETQIEQMLLNLAANARDAMPDGGTLSITVRKSSLTAPNRWDLPPRSYASIIVSDDGVGIDEKVLTHIFEPFFTTKQVGKGTGLGLATVFANVTRLKGKVAVESQIGKGTTFTIMLPESSSGENVRRDSPSSTPISRASETILLVEDDHALRRAARLALVRAGHKVVEARDGEEAERLGKESGQFTMLVTDVAVPKKPGPTLASALREVHPDLRVLYVSGYLQDTDSLDLSSVRTAYLAKPYTGAMLIAALRRLRTPPPPEGTLTQHAVPDDGSILSGGGGVESDTVAVADAAAQPASTTVAIAGSERSAANGARPAGTPR